MKTYVLKPGSGMHRQNGIEYHAGDAVNSTRDLAEAFPHKFQPAPAGVEGTKWPIDIPDGPGEGKAYMAATNPQGQEFGIYEADGKPTGYTGTFRQMRKLYREKFAEDEEEAPKAKAKKEVPPPEDDDEEDDGDEEAPKAKAKAKPKGKGK